MSTSKQIAANKKNANKSTGPDDTSMTRFNALKSGLTGRGLSPMDDTVGFNSLLTQLRNQFKPVGSLENFLVERIALGMVRRKRSERLDAAHLDADLHRAIDPLAYILDSRTTNPPLTAQTMTELCNISGRYETSIARRLHADVQLLQTLQRGRSKTGFVS